MADIVLTSYIAASFKSFLNELQASKIKDTEHHDQLMSALTMAAQVNIRDSEIIVNTIRGQLKIVCPESRILIIELIDSIILFVGGAYKDLFEIYRNEIFAEAGKDADADIQLKLSEFEEQWNNFFISKDNESQAIDTIPNNESVKQMEIADILKQIDEMNKRERAYIAKMENTANHQHPHPEIVKDIEMNPRKKFKKNRPSMNRMQKRSSSNKAPAKKNKQQLAKSSGVMKLSADSERNVRPVNYIALWMEKEFNSLTKFNFYSENI